MKITLAPIPFYWSRESVFDFYKSIETSQVDRVILGETICSKRRELSDQDYIDIGERLVAAGKEVFISSLALLEANSELKSLTTLCKQSPFPIEANDLAVADLCFELGKPFIGGPYLNIYSSSTLKILQKDGMTDWTLPFELGKSELAEFIEVIRSDEINIETEVMVYGYIPLALSARCFTARALDIPKDQCKRRCIEYPEGIPVSSQEGELLFNLNGIQTLSGKVTDLRSELPVMQEMGVDRIRIVPSQFDMLEIIEAFQFDEKGATAPTKDGVITSKEPIANVQQESNLEADFQNDDLYCNGYWYGEAGKKRVIAVS